MSSVKVLGWGGRWRRVPGLMCTRWQPCSSLLSLHSGVKEHRFSMGTQPPFQQLNSPLTHCVKDKDTVVSWRLGGSAHTEVFTMFQTALPNGRLPSTI
ncbi:hypothetical protein E2C01_008981 [Portunus trituberculatus]|uniref:Uncharacterized protein n=1 Tax=Portunus trituberculatus TaxID=210409 RepID=A0A5B7D498_PORTR|nr:hypothetical protein [Portunus trituberculatus]